MHVVHGHEVAAAKGVAVVVAIRRRNGGLAELAVLCGIRPPAHVIVAAGGINAVMEALTLYVAILAGWLVPAPWSWVVILSADAR